MSEFRHVFKIFCYILSVAYMFFHRYEIFWLFQSSNDWKQKLHFAFVLTSVQMRQCSFPPLWYMNLDVDSEGVEVRER